MSDDGSSMRRENVVTESAEPPIAEIATALIR